MFWKRNGLITVRHFRAPITAAAVLTLVGALGCADLPTAPSPPARALASETATDPGGRYLVVFATEHVPSDFGAHIVALGGAVEAPLDGIGVVAVTGLTAAAASDLGAMAGVLAVEPDLAVRPSDSLETSNDFAEANPSEVLAPADAVALPTEAKFFARQWNLRAVFADQAWAAGYLGSREVVVAIVDTGIDYLAPDLAGLVDLERSTSLVPEEDVAARYPGRLPFTDLNFHGTAVAGLVASNAKFVAGINRHATLLAVKVRDSTQLGYPSRFVAGIVYAADQGADVINVSGGSKLDKSESSHSGLVSAYQRAVNYAFRKGALVVSVPFNDAEDLDHNGDTVRMPCEAANAICVSATGPTAAAGLEGPWTDVDAIEPYTGFGRSAISVAAPGGGGGPNRLVLVPCTTTPTAKTGLTNCRLHLQPFGQAFGTSLSAPHVSGLAALLVAQLGHGNPALIRARILQTADDLGEPGLDPYYGHGRINVARALGLVPSSVQSIVSGGAR